MFDNAERKWYNVGMGNSELEAEGGGGEVEWRTPVWDAKGNSYSRYAINRAGDVVNIKKFYRWKGLGQRKNAHTMSVRIKSDQGIDSCIVVTVAVESTFLTFYGRTFEVSEAPAAAEVSTVPGKACATCGKTKPLSDYTARSRSNDGRQYQCRLCVSVYNRGPRKAHPRPVEQLRAESLKKKHGITPVEYQRLLSLQGHRCGICGTDTPRGHGAFHVDHDHATGVIRGLLCHSCNVGLGHLRDNVEAMANGIAWLQRGKRLPGQRSSSGA